MERFKWRFQLLMATLVLLASTALTSFYIYESEKHADQRAEASAKYINTVYESVIEDLKHTYKFRALGNLMINGFEETLISQDHDKLYALIKNRFTTMQEENPDLKIMQFHAPNGISILRVHEKEVFGDNIAAKRPLIQRVHKSKAIHSGFEGGIAGVAYRIIVPYFHGKEYIGAVEFGVDVNYINKEIHKITGYKSIFLLHESRIAAASTQHRYSMQMGHYRPIELEPSQHEILKLYMKNNSAYNKKIIEYDRHYYEIVPILLKGDDGHEMGMFLCINDITDGYHNVNQTIAGSFIITIILIIFFLGINESVARMFMKKVRFQEEYIETILNSQNNIIMVTDGQSIVYVNNSFLDYFHYGSLDEFNEDYPCICNKFESSDTEHFLQPEIDGMTWVEYILTHQKMEHKAKITVDGKVSIFSVNARQMKQENESRFVVVFTDVTDLNRLATLDQLTQIPNRFEFDKALAHAFSIAKRYERTFSILLLDIDHFKHINDNYGHLVGDEVLKNFSGLIKHQIRDSDMVARWGGEEFMILLPNTTLEAAKKMAESLHKRIEVQPFEHIENITCSIGVAEYRQGEEANTLLKRVDEKLYHAKNNGRNQVVA